MNTKWSVEYLAGETYVLEENLPVSISYYYYYYYYYYYSMSALQVKIVPLLDVHQLLMLFARTLTYSEPKTFALINCYNML
jgi:hypothetical protein